MQQLGTSTKAEMTDRRTAADRSLRLGRSLLAMAFVLGLMGCSNANELPSIDEIRSLQDQGRVELSVQKLRMRIDSGDRSPEVLLLYGRGLMAEGLWSQAIWALEEARQDPAWFTEATLQLGSGAYQGANFDVAIDFMDEILEKEPEHIDALRLRSHARLRSRRNYEGALEDAERVIELDEQSIDMQGPRVVALLGLGRVEEAGELLEELAEAGLENPDESEESAGASSPGQTEDFAPLLCVARAKYLLESGESDRAAAFYDECFERFPAVPLVVNDAIAYHADADNPERAAEILETAYETTPGNRSLRLGWARHLQLTGRTEEAREVLEKARKARLPGAWMDLAGFLIDKGEREAGIEIYQKALESGVDEPTLRLALGEALLSADRVDEAAAVASGSIVEAHKTYLLGRVELKRERWGEALGYLDKATLHWPDNPLVRYYAGIAAERAGDFDRAIEEYRYVLRIDASAADARMRLARLHMAEANASAALYVLRHRSIGMEPIRTNDEAVFLELEAVSQTGQPPPKALVDEIQDPTMWGQAVAAIARGIRKRAGRDAAIEFIQAADRLDLASPSGAPALRLLTDYLLEKGETDVALEHARLATERRPRLLEFRIVLGMALEKAGRLDDAHEAYSNVLERRPANPAALHGRARVALANDDVPSALADLARIAADGDDPDISAGIRAHAELLAREGRTDEAEARLVERLDRAPTDGQAAFALARLRLDRGVPPSDVRSLLQRSLRFGAGRPAADLLARLDAGQAA